MNEQITELLKLMDIPDLQKLQNTFAKTYDVASAITTVDGKNITEPSNYSKVCQLINSTEIGSQRCRESNQCLGSQVAKSMKPELMHCRSCGFWEASAPIIVAGTHVASWHISHKDCGVTDDKLRSYAVEIGLAPDTLVMASRHTQTISEAQFMEMANLLWLISNRISKESYAAYSAQKALAEQRRLHKKLKEKNTLLRKLASESVMTEEQMKRDIASQLHDSIGHSLVTLKRDLHAYAKTLPEGYSLEKDCNDIEDIINQTRTLTFRLGTPILYDFGITAALNDLADELFKPAGIEFTFNDHCVELIVPSNYRTVIYRMCSELCFNIVKHADASKVNVDLYYRRNSLIIVIKDNGKGFKYDHNKGLGLFGIREQLKYYGGTMHVHSVIGSGTCITICFPLQEEV